MKTIDYGTVQHNGETLTLEQQAFPDTDGADTDRIVYKAHAHDAAGNRYLVQWPVKEAILTMPTEDRPEDDSEWCDWHESELIKLVESAE